MEGLSRILIENRLEIYFQATKNGQAMRDIF